VFSSLFFITLPNIGKYFPRIHFPKKTTFLQTNGVKRNGRNVKPHEEKGKEKEKEKRKRL